MKSVERILIACWIDPWRAIGRPLLVLACLAFVLRNCGCRTLTIDAPSLVAVKCHKAAPGHWRVVVDGTERLKLNFPGEVPEVLPCPPR